MAAYETGKTIVLARVEDQQVVVRERRTDLGERPEMGTVKVAKTIMWRNRVAGEGLEPEIAKAHAWAAKEGWKVFIYDATEPDPFARAKREVLAGVGDLKKKTRVKRKAPDVAAQHARRALKPTSSRNAQIAIVAKRLTRAGYEGAITGARKIVDSGMGTDDLERRIGAGQLEEFGLRKTAWKTAAPMAARMKETYPQAHKRLLEFLKADGWAVVTTNPSGGPMKVPHATEPGPDRRRVWFKAQSVYGSASLGSHGPSAGNLASARSLMIDVRGMSGDTFVANVQRLLRGPEHERPIDIHARRQAEHADPKVFLSASGGHYRVIQGGMQVSKDMPTAEEALAVARHIGLDVDKDRYWDGDAGIWRSIVKPAPTNLGARKTPQVPPLRVAPAPAHKGFTHREPTVAGVLGHKIVTRPKEAPSFRTPGAREASYRESENLAREMAAHEREDVRFRAGQSARDLGRSDPAIARKLDRMTEILERHHYADPRYSAARLVSRGMNVSELEHRVTTGQLEDQFGLKKRGVPGGMRPTPAPEPGYTPPSRAAETARLEALRKRALIKEKKPRTKRKESPQVDWLGVFGIKK